LRKSQSVPNTPKYDAVEKHDVSSFGKSNNFERTVSSTLYVPPKNSLRSEKRKMGNQTIRTIAL